MNQLKETISELHQQRLLTDLDLHFARLMLRLDGRDNRLLALAAALTSHAVLEGNICLDLEAVASSQKTVGGGAVITMPEFDEWVGQLKASTVIGQPGDYTPLVLDSENRLYLYRYWDYEQQLGRDLIERAEMASPHLDESLLKEGLDKLFASNNSKGTDWQKVAAATALMRRFCIISGGPGTGKTTTVVRLLALLIAQEKAPLAIALAAPTGKAAARLEESIRRAKGHLDIPESEMESIPERALTIHRLLGGRGNGTAFRFNNENPLPVDVLIVDEASMVDLALMSRLVQALPAHARLILLGDRNQLASVEAGAVLGDICGVGSQFSQTFRNRLEKFIGTPLDSDKGNEGILSDSIVFLRQSFRFDEHSGIGQLASAVIQGDEEKICRLFGEEDFSDISLSGTETDVVAQAVEGLGSYFSTIALGADPADIFAAFERFRLLCATRAGEQGVERLNHEIEKRLAMKGLIKGTGPWYSGRPVMITRNDYNLHLYNGDIGIALEGADGQLKVWFCGADGLCRAYPPSRLPAHETVYAMTVHKSQGSEFDHVMLVFPEHDMPILSRELVYTGITRAKEQLNIISPPELLSAAVNRVINRKSGLREMLWSD